ncbi:MAG: polysaccharide biosynthesis transport protein [Actinomycetota bacterium]|jgi:capsular exopolysaccharide synthesis family protein|nr:polysaccharide biosynthesis transport protein [Actinomycetota bacterium]
MQTPLWAPSQQQDTSFLDIRDYLAVLKRRRLLIVLACAVFVALSVVYTFTQTKIYTSTAQILVQEPIQAAASVSGSTQPVNLDNETALMLSDDVAKAAALALKSNLSPQALIKKVEVTTPANADVLQVHFSDPNPSASADGAMAFARGYLDYKTNQAQAELDQKKKNLNDAAAALKAAGDQAGAAAIQAQIAPLLVTIVDPGTIIVPASVPTSPTSPNLIMNIALALFLGLFVGVIGAYIRERMDDRLRGRHDLEEVMGTPVMTMIPTVTSWRDKAAAYLITLEAPRSPTAEAYRTLRTSILVSAAERGMKTLMVVSAVAGEGKSTTAANLAVVLAQADKRVVLISADLRRPRLHQFFGMQSERGLSEVLEGDRRPWESLRSGLVDNLWVMSSGKVSDHPTELLQSPAMQELIAEQREVVDFIIIDCPPVLAVADALVVAPLVDGVLYVADANATPRGAVIQARAQLDQVGAVMLGAVLNNVDTGSSGYAFYGQHPDLKSSPNGNGRHAAAPNKGTVWEQLRKDRSPN